MDAFEHELQFTEDQVVFIVKTLLFRHWSRKRPLNDSITPFSTGLPERMKSICMRWRQAQSSRAFGVNSLPWSTVMAEGCDRVAVWAWKAQHDACCGQREMDLQRALWRLHFMDHLELSELAPLAS